MDFRQAESRLPSLRPMTTTDISGLAVAGAEAEGAVFICFFAMTETARI
jgi:hypothetical protein